MEECLVSYNFQRELLDNFGLFSCSFGYVDRNN